MKSNSIHLIRLILSASARAALILLTSAAFAAISNVRVQTTATQAVLSFVADGGACVVQVYETGSSTLVHDVNPVLFSGSNVDTRESLRHGDYRQFVVGRRVADPASDGKKYSRALQALTEHDYVLTCGASVSTGRFRTTNVPTGQTYTDPHPADPSKPGEYRYPDLSWTDRNQKVIDPQSGIVLRRLTMPTDGYEEFEPGFLAPRQTGSAWVNATAVLADDSSAATYTGSARDLLRIPFNYTRYASQATHSQPQPSMNRLEVSLNSWCQGASCSSASADDRTIEMCLSIDEVQCTSGTIERVLAACSSGCTSSTYRFTVGTGLPIMADWFPTGTPNFDAAYAHRRLGIVNRNGTAVTWQSGHKFSIRWIAGTLIDINSVTYTIASVDSENGLTLASAPAGTETSASYSTAAFQLMLRKKTASTHTLAVQHASWKIAEGPPVSWAAGGDQEFLGNCSFALVTGPSGELGWHCRVGTYLYWIGKDTGDVILFGWTNLPGRDGPDGWATAYCLEAYLNKTDPNVLYCLANGNSGDSVLLEAKYNGSHQPITFSINSTVPECSFAQQPCWTIQNLTPSSQGLSLASQMASFHPDWAGFKTPRGLMVSQTGTSNGLQFQMRRDTASNDLLAFTAVFDVATRRIVAAQPSWKYYPSRWGPLHGGSEISDDSHVVVPVTFFRGPFTGNDGFAGNGPYLTTITSGAVGATGSACPARPFNSAVPESEWPTGNNCIQMTVAGEPEDPTPAKYDVGTVSTSGSTVTGFGTAWSSWHSGGQMKLGSVFYAFTYVSPTQGILSPTPPVTIASPYTLFLEPVNNPKTADPNHGYLQDAEVRDVFCGVSDATVYFGGCGLYFQTEFFRLILKTGNTWTMQRGYPANNAQPFLTLPANSKLIAFATSCAYDATYPCANSGVIWNFATDRLGRNDDNASVIVDRKGEGSGHGFIRPGLAAASIAGTCEAIDGDLYRCYNLRLGTLPGLVDSPNFRISLNPPFAGRTGLGSPNDVDSHPSRPQFFGRLGEPVWFLDARPFNGGAVLGSPQDPGVKLSGNLYRFRANQTPRLRPKHMPTLALCGYNRLVDVSGPTSSISGSGADSYRYCVANANGECASGSSAGDLFVNCPMISKAYCEYAGVATSPADTREICVTDVGPYTESIVQVGVFGQDMGAKHSRVLTSGLALHKWNDVFWNVRGTPDGKWAIFRNSFASAVRTEAFLVKIPPYPPVDGVNRSTYIPVKVRVGRPSSDVTNVVAEFGYNPQFHCTSRQEGCVNGADSEHKYWSEGVTGVSCSTGCEVTVPAIAQRVVYYRLHYRNSAGQTVKVGPTEVVATP